MNEEDVWNLFEEFKKEDDTGVDNTNVIKCSLIILLNIN